MEVRQASFHLPNLEVAFLQPVTKSGPLFTHLQHVGQSIHHLAFGVAGNLDDIRTLLEEKGGTWNGGTKGGNYVFVDFTKTLGTTLELIRQSSPYSDRAPAPVP